MPLDRVPEAARDACRALRGRLLRLLGGDLISLWAHGAVAFENPPRRLGDVDTHAVLARRLEHRQSGTVGKIHEAITRASGIELDSWYILEKEAQGARPPRHLLRDGSVDDAWALHRAHWLAGRYVALHGAHPARIVTPPTWTELVAGLRSELEYLEQLAREDLHAPGPAAFTILNGCRIIYSVRTQDVVTSKRAAGRWGLEHLPRRWHPAIEAAERAYDLAEQPGDASVLKNRARSFVAAVREALGRSGE